MNTARTVLLPLTLLLSAALRAQGFIDPDTLRCTVHEGPMNVIPLRSDSLASSFLICVHSEVRPHFHRAHTEHVIVIEGEAIMHLGDEKRTITGGDVIVIPAGTVHAVSVIGTTPLRVISVQAPYFDGSDRFFVDQER